LQQSFGSTYDATIAENLRTAWASGDKLKNGLDKFAKQNERALMIEQEKKAAVIRKKAIYNIVNCLILFAAFLRIGAKIGSVGIEKNYYNN